MMNRTLTTAKRVLLGVLVVALLLVVAPASPISERLVAHADAGDWTMYLGDIGRSNFNPSEDVLSTSTAATLHVQWSAAAGGPVSAQPIVANGMVYWGAWDCFMRATNLAGQLVWQTYLGASPCSVGYRITSTPTIADITVNGQLKSVLFEPEGSGFYALDALDGAVLWYVAQTSRGPNWSSPLIYNGFLYVGVGGIMFQMDPATGARIHSFRVTASGCSGAIIWGSGAVDASSDSLYFATGDAKTCQNSFPYAQAVIALNASNLTLSGAWQVPDWQAKFDGDFDFGNTPTLFTATIGGEPRNMLGIASKDGIYYAFDRSNVSGGPVWQTRIAMSGDAPEFGNGSVSPSSWDGGHLFVAGGATTIGGTTCAGSLRELDPATGEPTWQDCFQEGWVTGAVTTVPGLAIVAAGNAMKVVDSSNGDVLFNQVTASNQPIYGAATDSAGVLYETDSGGVLTSFTTSAVPNVSVSPPSAAAYPTILSVDGNEYAPDQTVNLFWDSSAMPVATSTATASGSFTASVQIPDVPSGVHTITAVGEPSGPSVTVPYSISGQTTFKHPTGTPKSPNVLVGHGFAAGEQVNLYWKTSATASPLTVLGSITASSLGDFTFNFTVPDVPYNLVDFRSVGQSTGHTVNSWFLVSRSEKVAPASGPSGTTAGIFVRGFRSKESLSVYWNCASAPCAGAPVATGTAKSDGSASIAFVTPAASSGIVYPVLVQGQTSSLTTTAPFSVTQ